MHSVLSYTRLAALTALLVLPNLHGVANEALLQERVRTGDVVQKPETVEWVYRVRYGYKDEWFRIFRKYQIAILEKQKELGYVQGFTVWSPSLHTSEDSRWDYRVVITRASHDAPRGASEEEVARQLFPDQKAFQKDEDRRWELTTNHWDLPIHQVDVNANE